MTQDNLRKLLNDMSLDEKIGQLIQLDARFFGDAKMVTGPTGNVELTQDQINYVGSVLSTSGASTLKKLQKEYMEKHPHHIPLLFMMDIINGYHTIFPIPLAQGCTFEPELVKKAAQIAAKESTAAGLHITFSPMVDLVRDARWGRVMESTGEDVYLNSCYAKAMVEGYQGDGLHKKGNMGACLKHFAAYGYPTGGREYDNVELSERTLFEDYLPAYEAAIKAGCSMTMTSFNTINRIPSTGNRWLMRDVLREKMKFDGVLISDYAAVEEMVTHGIAMDKKEAARLAIEAGVDIDMMSAAYLGELKTLVQEGEISIDLIDESVMRVLQLKNDLGLFENPYKDACEEDEKNIILCDEHRRLARKVAAASLVLLKNEEELLPLPKESEGSIAFMGPYAMNHELYGSWSWLGTKETTVDIRTGVLAKRSEKVEFYDGCPMYRPGTRARGYEEGNLHKTLDQYFEEAVEGAKSAKTVVMCLGEHRAQTGEATSRTDITIPEVQMELLRKVHEVNENIVTIIFNGRPLDITELEKLSKSILVAWMPGTEGGNAIADVIFGDVSPSGKLSMCFPRAVGQTPIYYSQFRTGRPSSPNADFNFANGYIDQPVTPLYPFGYGLSYSEFTCSNITLNQAELVKGDKITATVTVTNTGKRKASETVQMYIQDVFGSVVRPLRELKAFEKIQLQPGEEKEITFEINEEMLRFYTVDMSFKAEPGKFRVYIGFDSDAKEMAEFVLNK